MAYALIGCIFAALALIAWFVAYRFAFTRRRDVTAWEDKRLRKQQDEILGGADRFVDWGVRLVTVRQDLEHGTALLPGKPPLSIVSSRDIGGMIDTKTMELCGPSEDPRAWYVSEDQARLILHESPLRDKLLVYGSEGGGKTVTLAFWLALRSIEFTGSDPRREIGVTAPTGPRLKVIRDTLMDWWPRAWWRWVERESCFYLSNGVTLRFISTHQSSQREGSRIQGFNWSAAASDELQDSIDRDADIAARLRAGPDGRTIRIATATAKDASAWRDWRDAAIAKGGWERTDLLASRSPFIAPSYLDELKSTLTDREWTRRQGAQDVPPEKQVYYAWSRAENIRARPQVENAAATVLAPWGGPFGMLCGHDPGRRFRYTVFLQPWNIRGRRRWWVVDELWSETGTVEEHVLGVRAKLRDRWGCNLLDRHGRPQEDSPRALVRTDIYTDTGGDAHLDRQVYAQFRSAGLTILPASQRANGVGGLKPAQIRKESRIDMINGLFLDATKDRRLFIDVDDLGRPVAPKLVHAIESMERDGNDRAETERKGASDLSHYLAALGYGLWAIEKPRAAVQLENVP